MSSSSIVVEFLLACGSPLRAHALMASIVSNRSSQKLDVVVVVVEAELESGLEVELEGLFRLISVVGVVLGMVVVEVVRSVVVVVSCAVVVVVVVVIFVDAGVSSICSCSSSR